LWRIEELGHAAENARTKNPEAKDSSATLLEVVEPIFKLWEKYRWSI
jgi:hypothetical protein